MINLMFLVSNTIQYVDIIQYLDIQFNSFYTSSR